MGLDITAYSKVVKEKSVPLDEYGSPVDWIKYHKAFVNKDFPGRAGRIKHGGIYSYADKFSFRAGGYGWYGGWRERLAILAGYPLSLATEGSRGERCHAAACWNGAVGPFSDLIYFADNQGILGTRVSKKLYADFVAFEDKARADEDEDFLGSYLDWKKAFGMAAYGGMVNFH